MSNMPRPPSEGMTLVVVEGTVATTGGEDVTGTGGRMGKLNPTSDWSACSISKLTGACSFENNGRYYYI